MQHTNLLSTFDGQPVEDLFAHLVANGDVTEVAAKARPVAMVSIHSAADDQGVTWYAVTDGADGAEVVINGDDAWEVAVEFATTGTDGDWLWDWSSDIRVPAWQATERPPTR